MSRDPDRIWARRRRGQEAVSKLRTAPGVMEVKNLSAYHLRVTTVLGREVDFWPRTGRWIWLNEQRQGFDADSFFEMLAQEQEGKKQRMLQNLRKELGTPKELEERGEA